MELTELVKAVLEQDALTARQWVADAKQAGIDWSSIPAPEGLSDRENVVSAALVELMAERTEVPAPNWTKAIGPLPEPLYLVRAASSMPRLRRLCEEESPLPLRRRRLYAPPEFLTSA